MNEYYDCISYHSYDESIDINDKDNNIENKKLFHRYGEYLLVHRNEILYKYLNKNKQKIEKILSNLQSDNENALNNADRIKELNDDLQLLREGLKYYEV